MDFDNIGKLISSVGFPIVVAVWLLFVHDKTIKQLTEAIHSLRETLQIYLTKDHTER